jgi:hypothetical protein
LTRHIEVQIDTWTFSEPGDTYQLMLNGLPTGPIRYLAEDAPEDGEFLTLSIDADSMLLKNGTYEVGYRIQNTLGGLSADSATTRIQVDRVSPGGGLLAPLIFPVRPCGIEIIGYVPGYAGICAGDVIQTQCNGLPGPTRIVTSGEVNQIVEIAFPWEFLEGMNARTVEVDYVITDRAGNRSINAQPTWIKLHV